jgi:hypothetical protein
MAVLVWIGEKMMANDELIRWKRGREDAHAWNHNSATYQADSDCGTKIFNIFSSIWLSLLIIFSVILPLFGLLSDWLDFHW